MIPSRNASAVLLRGVVAPVMMQALMSADASAIEQRSCNKERDGHPVTESRHGAADQGMSVT